MIETTSRANDDSLRIDKISDEIYILSQNVILKFNVSLSKISSGKRYHYYKDFEYRGKDYNGQLISVKRSFDYYLSFENIKAAANGSKMFIRIGLQEFLSLSNALDAVEKWFTDAKYKKLFVSDKGKLILTSPTPSHLIPNLPMGNSIEFRPTIITKGIAASDEEPGIAIEFVGFETIYIGFDKFMGLKYLINSFNMYQSAITLLNFVGRPPATEDNRILLEGVFNKKPLREVEEPKTTSINGRFPKGMTNISHLEG